LDLEQIAHYRVERLLGAGGMGEVYLAEDTRLDRKVALKLLPQRFSADEERVRRFQREARAASALNHPNIITIYEIGQANERHYIATEFIEGETLRARVAANRRMSVAEVLDVGMGVANALAAAHEAGIIHRDIKPENIMVRPDGYVKVLDFGLAKLLEPGNTNTNTGAVMGTLLYLAPEQARGARYPDARSDIYSLGAVLYEMLTRRPPIMTDSFVELAIAITTVDPEPPSKTAPGLPPDLDRIVMKALEKDPDKRYQNAREMLADLRALRRELDLEASYDTSPDLRHSSPVLAHQPTLPMSTPPFGRRRRRVRPLLAIGAGIAILAAIVWVLARGLLGADAPIGSVAVLPFVNASGDPSSEYLSDGLSESITDSLSQLPNLQVVARSKAFRYKGKNIDPLLAGRDLRVRGVVTGRVFLRGDTLVIRASLTDVKKGTQIWGEQYDRRLSDVLAVQKEMAQEISNKLRTRLSGDEVRLLERRTATSSEAFQLYLKGRYYRHKYTEEAIRKAVSDFNQAIDRDPTYALAWAGLADAYYGLSNLYMAPREAMPRARDAAQRALAIDDSLAQAHTSLALVMVWYDWDFAGGEREFRRALSLNPNDAESHRLYGSFLAATGQFNRSLTEMRLAEQLDPLSVAAAWDVGRVLFYAGRYAEAREQAKKALELDDRFGYAYMLLAQIAAHDGHFSEALGLMQKAIASGGRTPLFVSMWGYINARAGNRGEALAAIDELKRRPSYTLPLFLARVYAALGENDHALQWLEQAYADRSESIVWLKVDPSLESLRGEERFRQLVRRVGV
jgi:eukaryotic-like serine/threonine-protein kinase